MVILDGFFYSNTMRLVAFDGSRIRTSLVMHLYSSR